jgi:hypothetical protein
MIAYRVHYVSVNNLSGMIQVYMIVMIHLSWI